MDTPLPPGSRAAVLLPVAVDGPFDYAVPVGLEIRRGQFVRVPLRGEGLAIGVVWGEGHGELSGKALKPVAEVLDMPPLTHETMAFIDWVADYTMSLHGMVLRMCLSAPAVFSDGPTQLLYRIKPSPLGEAKISSKRQRVLDFLSDGRALTLSDIARETSTGVPTLREMAKVGLLEAVRVSRRLGHRDLDPDYTAPKLSPDQQTAAAALRSTVARGGFDVTLLDGVTGSGKTEVYFEAVAEALAQGRQALVMVPEIALSAQFVERFKPRFGAMPALWHSALTPAQRRDTWKGVADGSIRVVIGARSALFLPFPELGLIVVDEENDQSYKQEDVVIYQARDMAVVRAKLGGFAAVLVSATPSLETSVNAETGRYRHVTLADRFGGATLPDIALVDLRADKPSPGNFLSPTLVQAVKDTIANGEQALLFLNRRGYAPLTLCRSCGHRMKCPNCTAWLVEHRARDRLVCHFCGHVERLPTRCPNCDAENSFSAVGPGVERIAEEAAALFPQARTVLMASDLMEGAAMLRDTLHCIRDHRVDLIIGTQIIAKGHHFPKLTLVGVVDADLGLNGGDLRASERTYQLLQQVAGRAGRAAHAGRALVQTFDPAHPVMQALASGRRDEFMAIEKAERSQAGQPPYTRLAALIVSSEDGLAAERTAVVLGRAAPHAGTDLYVLGPAPAPLSLLRNRYRYRLLLKTPRNVSIQGVIRDWLARVEVPKTVRVQIDIDPYSFL
jgi:primosomal protein N' (replication factor Y)